MSRTVHWLVGTLLAATTLLALLAKVGLATPDDTCFVASSLEDKLHNLGILGPGIAPTEMDQNFEDILWSTAHGPAAARVAPVAAGGDAPSPRTGASLTLFASRAACLLFGGASLEAGCCADLHRLALDSMEWSEVVTAGDARPPARYEHFAAAVRRRRESGDVAGGKSDHLLVFGGASEMGPLGDVWLLDLDSLSWSPLKTRGKAPTARLVQSCGLLAGDDSSADRVRASDRVFVLFGGERGSAAVADSAVYCLHVDSGLWIQLTDSSSDSPECPPPRFGHTVVTVSGTGGGDRLLVWGGAAPSGGGGGNSSDDSRPLPLTHPDPAAAVWVFHLDSRRWERARAVVGGGGGLTARCGQCAGLVRDGRLWLVVHGGSHWAAGASAPAVLDDVWGLDVEAMEWHRFPIKREAGMTDPLSRFDHASAVVDLKRPASTEHQAGKILLMFGGMSTSEVYNDL
ncbi:hypothetical protein HK405_005830, partial [Cladochytrium tenue]